MSALLRLDDGFAGHGDNVYEALIRGHDGLSEDESAALNARLILLLANEIGDLPKLQAAIRLARDTVRPAEAAGPQP